MRFLVAGLAQTEAERRERTQALNDYALHLAKFNWTPFSEVETRTTWWFNQGPFAPGRPIAR